MSTSMMPQSRMRLVEAFGRTLDTLLSAGSVRPRSFLMSTASLTPSAVSSGTLWSSCRLGNQFIAYAIHPETGQPYHYPQDGAGRGQDRGAARGHARSRFGGRWIRPSPWCLQSCDRAVCPGRGVESTSTPASDPTGTVDAMTAPCGTSRTTTGVPRLDPDRVQPQSWDRGRRASLCSTRGRSRVEVRL